MIQQRNEIHPRPRRLVKKLPVKYVPNIVPLIDVLFMLLLFFLLGTKFRQSEKDIPMTLPQSSGVTVAAVSQIPLDPIRITVRPSGPDRQGAVYEIAGSTVTAENSEELYRILTQRRAALESNELPVIFQPQGDVRWQYVVEGFHQSLRAELHKISIATGS